MITPDVLDDFSDPSECPGKSCPAADKYGYSLEHTHCPKDGNVLFAEGGGDDDGSKVAGYEDCVECKARAESDAAQAADMIMQDLAEALQRIRSSRAALNGETDRAKLDQCRRLLNDLDCEIFEYETALAPRLMKAVAA